MRRTALILACTLLAAAAHAETLLRLSETATIPAHPDELAAIMRVEAQAPTAAAAQSAVNAAMAKALAAAKSAGNLNPGTGGYQVYQVPQPSPHWQAAQTLSFAGSNQDDILRLVGTLQSQGLAVQALTWRLKPETAKSARDAATAKALAALRARADAAAHILNMTFANFREIRLDGTQPQAPMPRLAMAMAAAPVAEAQDIDVSATVEADVILK